MTRYSAPTLNHSKYVRMIFCKWAQLSSQYWLLDSVDHHSLTVFSSSVNHVRTSRVLTRTCPSGPACPSVFYVSFGNSSPVLYLETVEEFKEHEGMFPQLPTPLSPGLLFSVGSVTHMGVSTTSPSGQGSELLCLGAMTKYRGLAACMELAKQV